MKQQQESYAFTEPRADSAVLQVNIVYITETQQLHRIYYD